MSYLIFFTGFCITLNFIEVSSNWKKSIFVIEKNEITSAKTYRIIHDSLINNGIYNLKFKKK